MKQVITAKLKLHTDSAQFKVLRQTQLAYRDALNHVSQYAFKHGKMSSKVALQDGTYKETSITLLVVEHRDRLTRFGFHYLETLLETPGRSIEVVNVAQNDQEDWLADLVAIVYSFTARLSGQRRAKRKTEHIVAELEAKDATR